MPATALIIDDEPDIRELLALTITRMGIDCQTAANLEEARNLLAEFSFSVCLTDMKLPDGNGVEFVRFVHAIYPDTPVAVITAHGNMEAAVTAMKNGAYDFVSKPVDIEQLRRLVATAVASHYEAANQPVHKISDEKSTDGTTDAPPNFVGHEVLVGQSPPMEALRTMIIKVAQTNAPVWITGESGTGKELIARLIHANSVRRDQPFVPINCGAIPAELMESELFGHKKGSFTGASADNPGLFNSAKGGTLFLDEVAELPLHMQVKLLRVIQEKSVRAVGSNDEIATDVRILSASHRDLAKEVEQGRFRHDLYYRLNVIKLRSPSLAERSEDIPQLCSHLLEEIARTSGTQILSVSNNAMEKICNYPFPGNVRELQNTLERAAVLCNGDIIDSDDLDLASTSPSPDSQEQTPNQPTTTLENRGSWEKEQILDVLNKTRWNRKEAAKRLNMTYRQLRYRIQQYKIDDS
ncbi:MAG: sigma-54 dependent transcriptional regulator [Granulosicoccus sp.]|nr:sigma-54 dependent transcriptional regulator [Granulosicoccus sp.]